MIYTVLDIETTGFSRDYDDILSVGFMRIDSSFDVKASGTLYFYKPNFNVGKYPACTVHKLSRSLLEQHEGEFANNLKILWSLLYMSNIIGKRSNKFDMPFINSFVDRYCPTLPSIQYNYTFDLEDKFAPIYKSRMHTTKTGTLTQYLECLGITQDQVLAEYQKLPNKDNESVHMHGALYDVVATFMVFKETCSILGLRP